VPYIGDLATAMCSAQTSKRQCVLRCLTAVLGVLVLAVLLRALVQQAQATSNPQLEPERAALQTLTIDQIAQIQIVDRCILPAAQFDAIVQALHDVIQFRLTPAPASYFGRLRITLHSGQVQEYRLYQQSYGMVLEFPSDIIAPSQQTDTKGDQSATYMISRTLADVIRCEQGSVALE